MTLQEIAEALVEGCRGGWEADNLPRLYAEDAVSVEAYSDSERDPVSRGRDAIAAKHAWWADTFETHAFDVDGPFLHGTDRFAVIYTVDAAAKGSGKRFRMREVAVYHVADGRIVREEFFAAL